MEAEDYQRVMHGSIRWLCHYRVHCNPISLSLLSSLHTIYTMSFDNVHRNKILQT